MATKKEAKIITIFNQKGGCGKTMTTMQLSGVLALKGKKVMVADMDRQGTSAIWSSNASPENPFPAMVCSLAPQQEKMIQELQKVIHQYDYILIDCPPALESKVPWASLQIADLAIIPVIPVMDNLWATSEAKDLAIRAKNENPALKTYYLPSCVRRGNLFKNCINELKKDPDVQVLNSHLTMRNSYPESQLFGSTVNMIDENSPAAQEVDALAAEIIKILKD